MKEREHARTPLASHEPDAPHQVVQGVGREIVDVPEGVRKAFARGAPDERGRTPLPRDRWALRTSKRSRNTDLDRAAWGTGPRSQSRT
jgi:hypothetical protein